MRSRSLGKHAVDIAYFEMRLKVSLRLAKSAADVCARLAYRELAHLYREKIAAMCGDDRSCGTDVRRSGHH